MLAASIFRRVREAAGRLGATNQGNVAVLFAIAVLPVLGLVGAAIDYSRASAARTSMQAALDSTALMLSKDLSSGIISLSGTPAQINAQLSIKALAYFNGLYTNSDAKANSSAPAITAVYTPVTGAGSTIVVSGSGAITTDIMNVVGFPTLSFSTSSTTTWGNVKMRVALALDNTGSMSNNNKIGALRTAVAGPGGLIDQLSALAQNPGDVYISVIPFAKVVNAGASNAGATWIDWTDWANPPTLQPNNGSYAATIPNSVFTTTTAWNTYFSFVGPGSPCPFTTANGFPTVVVNRVRMMTFGCTSNPANGSPTVSTIPSSGNICPGLDNASHTYYNGCWTSVPSTTRTTYCTGSSCSTTSGNYNGSAICTGNGSNKTCTELTYTHAWVANATSTWTGCITDRTQSFDETGDAPTLNITATLFPAYQWFEPNGGTAGAWCDPHTTSALEPVMPLSYNWSTLKTAVNAMQPTSSTNQSVGLAWAWQSLLQTGPIPAPQEDSNTIYNRVIIILSDGLNTEDRWPDNGDGTTQNGTSIDVRQAQQCANIKAATDSNGRPMFTIYTIQVDTSTPPDPVSTVLQNCASDSSKFFMLTNSNQIATTFTTIGTALSELRVSN
jgi:Flp pilus assembly protein TadG